MPLAVPSTAVPESRPVFVGAGVDFLPLPLPLLPPQNTATCLSTWSRPRRGARERASEWYRQQVSTATSGSRRNGNTTRALVFGMAAAASQGNSGMMRSLSSMETAGTTPPSQCQGQGCIKVRSVVVDEGDDSGGSGVDCVLLCCLRRVAVIVVVVVVVFFLIVLLFLLMQQPMLLLLLLLLLFMTWMRRDPNCQSCSCLREAHHSRRRRAHINSFINRKRCLNPLSMDGRRVTNSHPDSAYLLSILNGTRQQNWKNI